VRPALLALLLAAASPALADEPPKKMESDRPMAGKMKKPGMKQRDVKRQSEKKEREMQPILRKEEKAMEPAR